MAFSCYFRVFNGYAFPLNGVPYSFVLCWYTCFVTVLIASFFRLPFGFAHGKDDDSPTFVTALLPIY